MATWFVVCQISLSLQRKHYCLGIPKPGIHSWVWKEALVSPRPILSYLPFSSIYFLANPFLFPLSLFVYFLGGLQWCLWVLGEGLQAVGWGRGGGGGSGFWLVEEYQCGECWNSSYKRIRRCFQSSFKQISSSITVWARIHCTFFCWNLGLEYRHKCLDCSASCSNYGKIFLIIAGRYRDLYLRHNTVLHTQMIVLKIAW